MRADTAWQLLHNLPVLSYEDAFGEAPVLVLAPHPDDESLGCGGMIAASAACGHPALVVFLTDGTMSHPQSAAWPADKLRDIREREAMAATRMLGLPAERNLFLRYRDSAAPTQGAPFAEAVHRLESIIRSWECQTVAVTWSHDPHCDHQAASDIALAACRNTGTRLVAYPVWGWMLPPESPIDESGFTGFRLDISHQHDRKRAAILAHETQYAGIITDDPGGFQMQPNFIEACMGRHEVFIEILAVIAER